jgi:hypothetical protein
LLWIIYCNGPFAARRRCAFADFDLRTVDVRQHFPKVAQSNHSPRHIAD